MWYIVSKIKYILEKDTSLNIVNIVYKDNTIYHYNNDTL